MARDAAVPFEPVRIALSVGVRWMLFVVSGCAFAVWGGGESAGCSGSGVSLASRSGP